jgi:adenosyl cobinamide kinase/adenosyl cobinamide phosphate guanylyltransferase
MITLVLGGARSGKSELAEQLAAARPGTVTYIATAVVEDADFQDRVQAHRDRRPASWRTIEAGAGLVEALGSAPDTALVDSLGTWLAASPRFEGDVPGLLAVLRKRSGDTIVVSEEVGLGVHPSTEVGGRFRDSLGALNRDVSAIADQVYLVVAGRAMRLDGPPVARPGSVH